MAKLRIPSNDLVREYIEKFNNDKRYYLADQAIIKLFQKFPENKILEDILLKISVINDMYSTNIFGTFIIAEHILGLGIDKDLVRGDPALVHKIATGHGILAKNSERNFYSFATKYCNWHNKEAYPIYDSFVAKILIAYRDEFEFSHFDDIDLKDYVRFKEIINDLRKAYHLTEFNLKEIDKFLWIYGKTMFPNNYSKK